MLSVSASVQLCHNPTTDSVKSMAIMEQMADTSDMHDCCVTLEDSCDCDNGQTASTVLSTIDNSFSDYLLSSLNSVIPSLFISKLAESPYRPPITTL